MKMKNKQRSFSVLGDVAIVNFPFDTKEKDKKEFAKKLLKEHNNLKTVVEKAHKFSGRLRKQTTRHLAGEKNKEVLYKENGCEFRFNIDETYFSPRLSNERKEISEIIKKGNEVLVMCAGVAPFSIVIAKNTDAKIVYSNELNRKANEYAKENVIRNKVEEKVILVPGDIKKVAPKLKKEGKNFDVIVMARPQLKDTFLKEAFMLTKSGTKIYYYDFCKVGEKDLVVDKVKKEAKKANKEIKILNIKDAGEIAPYKVRLRIDFEIVRKNWFRKIFRN
jgi:tRNA (guanine37-N1)-methyltransferase